MSKEMGCQNCRVSRNIEDGDGYVLYSDWDAQANLEGYMRSGSGSALLGAVDLLGESTRIRMGIDAAWEGIEILKRMRRVSRS